jgi:M6 family metalloprotease-like protein
MTRFINIIIAILLGANILFSAPIKNLPIKLIQPNGKEINCFVSGDEFFNYIHDEQGYLIIYNDDSKYYCYGVQEKDKFYATQLIVGENEPISGIVSKGIDYSTLNIQNLREKFVTDKVTEEIAAPKTGVIENVVVFIRFAGEPEFNQTVSVYDNMFNNSTPNTNSMYNYFKEVSYNQLTVNTHFFPLSNNGNIVSYQDSYPRAYYQPSTGAGSIGYSNDNERTNREFTLLKNAINYIASSVPSSLKIDGDNDGEIDNVCFIVSGSPTGWSSLLWPHMWYLYGQTAYINGKRVGTFNFQLQNSLMSSGVGVLCHEMFHSLGAPDLYHYTENGISPVGTWDIMENDLNPPQHMGAHMKFKYGKWISSIPVISTDGTYLLNPLTESENNCYRINSPRSSNEYFIVEYRKRNTIFESSLSGEGLLVYRIDRRYNGNADGPPDEVYLYRPYGSPSANGVVSQANLGAHVGRTFINSGSNPNAFLYNGTAGGLNIYDISFAGDNITFKVKIENSISTLYPNGGETFSGGDNIEIKWENFGATTNFDLYFSSDNGQNWNLIEGNLASTLKTYTFQLPNVISFECKVKIVSSSNPGIYDESDYCFSVSPAGIYNISLLNSSKVGGFTNSIEKNGDYVFVSSKSAGLHAIDLSNVNNPIIKGTYDSYGSALYAKVVDTLAFLADMTAGVSIISVKNPEQMYLIKNITVPGQSMWLDIKDNVLYVSNKTNGIRIFDISDKLNPVEKFLLSTTGTAGTLKIFGNMMILAEGLNGVSFYDISDKYNPVKVGFYDTPGTAVNFDLKDNILFIADKTMGTSILDISDLQNIHLISNITNIGSVNSVKIENNYLYVACESSGIRVYDISNLNSPKISGYYLQDIYAVDIIPNNEVILGADQSKGLFIFKNEIISDVEDKFDLQVNDFKVYQNYPNPFNPTTKISFYIPKAGNVNLRVFNVLGQLVKSMELMNLSNGLNYVEINGNGLSSGVYLYSLEYNNTVITNKMVLLK